MATGTTVDTEQISALGTEISTWLADQLARSGAERFVLGLSGGVDSAVVCGLCVKAAGPERVLGVIMPSHSHPEDAECAREVAATFGVQTVEVDLSDMTAALLELLPDRADLVAVAPVSDAVDSSQLAMLATANVRPRLRMITNYYLANMTRGIVAGTGNKSEAMIGYFTKYGDGGVDLFPIIDLYKFEVRALARVLGVPQRVIDRPPSAGLWTGQTDEGEIGLTYAELDRTLMAIERGDTSEIDPAVLSRVQGMISSTQHKRSPIPAFRR